MLSGWQFFTGGIMLCTVSLLCGARLVNPCIEGFAILTHLAMVSAVAYTLRSILLKYNNVSKVTVYSFLIPIFGVIMAAVLLGEKDSFTWMTFGAMLLICLSIGVVNHSKKSYRLHGQTQVLG